MHEGAGAQIQFTWAFFNCLAIVGLLVCLRYFLVCFLGLGSWQTATLPAAESTRTQWKMLVSHGKEVGRYGIEAFFPPD